MLGHVLLNPLQLPVAPLPQRLLVPQHPPLGAVPAGVGVRAAAQYQRGVDAVHSPCTPSSTGGRMGYSAQYLTNDEWMELHVAYKAHGSGPEFW